MCRVYLAGPITGLSYLDARYGWRKMFADRLHPSIQALSPMRQEGHLAEIKVIGHTPYDSHQLSSSKGIVGKDKLDVQRSDLVVFNFLGAKVVSRGSLIELGWADAYGKPIIIVLEKADTAAFQNPHDYFFATELAQFRVDSIEEAAEMTNALLLPGI